MTPAVDADIDVQALERVRAKLRLEWTDLAATIGVDQSTLYRWRNGEATPRPIAASRLVQIGELMQMLRRLFAGPDLTRAWLKTAKPEMLEKQTPLAVMRAGRIDRVLTLLHITAKSSSRFARSLPLAADSFHPNRVIARS
jgi:DNA-binding XRE family transcriptional regulator